MVPEPAHFKPLLHSAAMAAPADPQRSLEARRSPYLEVFANPPHRGDAAARLRQRPSAGAVHGHLQAWLTVEGVDIKTIGFFALAGLPYTFKFVWAPLLDRFEPPRLGRRRGWLIASQLLLAAACLAMAELDPRTSIAALGACAVAIAFLSASQDIVFDAYRSDLLGDANAARAPRCRCSATGWRCWCRAGSR